ncbi:hypothetical protein KAW44_02160 [Candidatus Bipolaricaulota bacterium]|nr:hypothetical protein [Candidatus Bipolaricaulota bacterium]
MRFLPWGKRGQVEEGDSALAGAGKSSDSSPEVVVLATLHQSHDRVDGYSFSDLSQLISDIAPDVIAVELTRADIESRCEQPAKQEYELSVFPLLGDHSYRLVPLEPDEPEFSDLVAKNRHSVEAVSQSDPEKHGAFSDYVAGLYSLLFGLWDSPLAVNSSYTDAVFRGKHAVQDIVYGTEQAEAWERWNSHFASTVLDTVRDDRSGRLLVLVGVEHAYWLRERLSREPALRFLSVEDALRVR